MIGFLLSIALAAKTQIAKSECRSVSTMAMDSVFGEYHKLMLEEYDLFVLDAAYLSEDYSEERAVDRYTRYINRNMVPDETGIGFLPVNWGSRMESAQIQGLQLATDDGAIAIQNQIRRCVLGSLGSDILQELVTSQAETGKNADAQRRQADFFEEKEKESKTTLSELEAQAEQKLQEQKEQPENANVNSEGSTDNRAEYDENIENPLTEVERIQSMGILDLVLPDGSSISGSEIQIGDAVSHRKLNKGYGEKTWKNEESGLLDRACLYFYLEQHLSSYADENDTTGTETSEGKTKHAMEYELEYILCGHSTDRENLESTVKKLLLTREGINFAYLLSDSSKQAEAAALATALTGYFGIPPLVEATKWALLLAWAYGESIMDVRTMLKGGRVPLVKTAADWKLELDRIGQIDQLESSEEGGSGLSYEQWIEMLLYTGNRETQLMRFLDMAEATIRKTEENRYFRMDHCISGLSLQNTWSLPTGNTYSFPIHYCYQ